MAATKLRNLQRCKCNACNTWFTLIELARKIENLPNASDEEILTKLKNDLNINVVTAKEETDIEKQLDKFVSYKWALIPCAKNGKNPIQKGWQTSENREKAEWLNWINTGLNLGVRTGEVSNLCVIDFDFYTKEEKILLVKEDTQQSVLNVLRAKKVINVSLKVLLGDTLIQETLGGFHIFYQATDLPKGFITLDGVHIDIQAEVGQIVIFPSPQVAVEEEYKDEKGEIKKRIVGFGKSKFINDNPIIKMPDELYILLKGTELKSSPKTKSKLDVEEISDAITNENFKIKDLNNNRNITMMKLGGILQKKMNIGQVGTVLNVLNHHLLETPLPQKEISIIVES